MSLSKQLLILVAIIFFIVSAVNFVLSIGNIKSYLEIESEIHAQDTATSLGLSLSPYMTNENDPIIRTMMNAIFDMGYYQQIRLLNADDVEIINLSNPKKFDDVPDWMATLVPMEPATAVSEISSGWNISGTLYVTNNPGYGYLKLYEQGKATLQYTLLLFIAALALLFIVLRFTLKPLKDIEKQANEISKGNFTQIEKLPWTLEVKNVALSMNSMSSKIGGMISRLNQKLASLSENLKRDALTNLLNQASFNADIKQAFSAGKSGYIVFIKFGNLGSLAKEYGNEKVDSLLIDFSQLLLQIEAGSAQAYRLYGSEFTLLCTNIDKSTIENTAEQLKQDLSNLGSQTNTPDLAHIGIVYFDKTSDSAKLEPAMREAYETATLIGANSYSIKEDIVSSMTDAEWKQTITDAINNGTPKVTLTSEAYSADGSKLVMEEAFTLVKDAANNTLSIGTFFSMAQEFNLSIDLDKCIVEKIISLMEEMNKTTPVTINLAMESITSSDFRSWLQSRVASTSLKPELLVFSVTAYTAAKDIDIFANFCTFVQSIGASILLKRYSSDIIDIELLKKLDLNYVRLATDLTMDIRSNPSKRDFLGIMHDVSGLLEIKVIAENVSADADFDIVKNIGLYGIGR